MSAHNSLESYLAATELEWHMNNEEEGFSMFKMLSLITKIFNMSKEANVLNMKVHEDGTIEETKEQIRVAGLYLAQVKESGDEETIRMLNKRLSLLHYSENAVRQLWRATRSLLKDSQPGSSQEESDHILFRFSTYDSSKHTSYQNLLSFYLSTLRCRNLRRYHESCMQQISTPEGHDTHAWEPNSSLDEFVYKSICKETQYDMWLHLTASSGNAKNASEFLQKTNDIEFPDIVPDRHIFAFLNGILNVKFMVNDVATVEFFPYGHPQCSGDFTASKYFEQTLTNTDVENWREIPTPSMQSILEYQFSPAVCEWMYILGGRLLFDTNELDSWQIIPFLKGLAGTGKSTLLTKVFKKFYPSQDVGILSNNMEKKFGLAKISDKLMFIGPEIKSDFSIDQADFQSMISGEDVSLARKHTDTKENEWKVPGILSGNVIPSWTDNSGSMQRRIVLFPFGNRVKNYDMTLDKKLAIELPLILLKCAKAYIETATNHRKSDIWTLLPQEFKISQKEMVETINSLQHFLSSDNVILSPEQKIRADDFTNAYRNHCQQNSFPSSKWTTDLYRGLFEENEIRVERKKHDKQMKSNKYEHGTWYYGVGVIENEETHNF